MIAILTNKYVWIALAFAGLIFYYQTALLAKDVAYAFQVSKYNTLESDYTKQEGLYNKSMLDLKSVISTNNSNVRTLQTISKDLNKTKQIVKLQQKSQNSTIENYKALIVQLKNKPTINYDKNSTVDVENCQVYFSKENNYDANDFNRIGY